MWKSRISTKDGKAYVNVLNVKSTEPTLGAVSYGMDFPDPANLLGIWGATGRHIWLNLECCQLAGDPECHYPMFRATQEILGDDTTISNLYISNSKDE